MAIGKKSTFMVPTQPIGEHLYIVISDPDELSCVLCVNVTGYKIEDDDNQDIDKSCVLRPGCHEFITKLSRIKYDDAILLPVSQIETKIENGIYRGKEKITDSLLIKIQQGAEKTDALPRKFKKYFKYF